MKSKLILFFICLLGTTGVIAQPNSSTGYFLVLNSDLENTVEVSNGSTLSLTKGDFFEIYNNNFDGWGGFGASLDVPFIGEERTFGNGGIGFNITQDGYYVFTLTNKGEENWFVSILRSLVKHGNIAAIPDQTFTGSAIEPEITVTDGENTLTLGTDYTVSYSDNINAGSAKATITGINNYSGTVEKTFTILPVTTVSAKADPYSPGTYYTTFYDSTTSYVADCEVYYVTANADGKITLVKAEGNIIKAGEGVVLKSSSASINLAETNQTASYNSLLTGSNSETTVTNALVLSLGEDGMRFYKYSGTVGAHKAYIEQ